VRVRVYRKAFCVVNRVTGTRPSDRTSSAQMFMVNEKKKKRFFVTTVNYCFCFNWTILHCLNKAIRKRIHRWKKWFQWIVELSYDIWNRNSNSPTHWNHSFHRWEGKEYDLFIIDKIILYRNRKGKSLIELCIYVIFSREKKWDFIYFKKVVKYEWSMHSRSLPSPLLETGTRHFVNDNSGLQITVCLKIIY
jgi:hypothetical protein